MYKFANLTDEERALIFKRTASKMNLNEAIVEKDFWVCWMLDYMFTKFQFREFLTFKGGTSLSKAFHMIKRFSEDIDLVLDWNSIGIGQDEPYIERSSNKQVIFNTNAKNRTEQLLINTWIPIIRDDLTTLLVSPSELYIDEEDGQTICFKYPRGFSEPSILQIIRLEIGALAERVPSTNKSVQSFVSEMYPDIFEYPKAEIRTVDANRTFFEKLTILHREANRVNGYFPKRYSRHFYDVFQMLQFESDTELYSDIELLFRVVDFNMRFYTCAWAKYQDIFIGLLKLIPNKDAIKAFESDYENMKNMIFGNQPEFSEIIDALTEFEIHLNRRILEFSIHKNFVL